MIPHGRLEETDSSSVTELLYPDSLFDCHRLYEDYEYGSLALQDPTGGLQQAVWHVTTDGESLTLQRLPDGYLWSLSLPGADITEVSLAFDTEMHLHLAWVGHGIVKLRWYNPALDDYEILEIEDAYSPRLTLDDKRPGQEPLSDVLFFYLRNVPGDDEGEGVPPALIYRQQREQFSVEHLLARVSPRVTGLGGVGMNTENRLQIDLCGCEPEVSTLLPTMLYPLEAEDRFFAQGNMRVFEMYGVQLEYYQVQSTIYDALAYESLVQVTEGYNVQSTIYDSRLYESIHNQYPDSYQVQSTMYDAVIIQEYTVFYATFDSFTSNVSVLGGSFS